MDQKFERGLIFRVSYRDGSYYYFSVYGDKSKLLSRPLEPANRVLMAVYEDVTRTQLQNIMFRKMWEDKLEGRGVLLRSRTRKRSRTLA